jgi:C-terminal processing protease CtpA/Prc
MALGIWTNGVTKQITAICVTGVKPGSDAEKVGIGLYTRIERIDGKPVEDMKASFGYGTGLNKVFVNRKPGDRLTLTVEPTGSISPFTVHLVNRGRNPTRPIF